VENQLKYPSKSFDDSKVFIWQFNSNVIFIFISFWSCANDIFDKFCHSVYKIYEYLR
jgi:hypothetical protein